ncbi:hypothetical protein D3C81_1970980 [compost metagenome]
MLAETGQHFASGNRCIKRSSQLSVAFNVIGIQRLFNPDQIELFHFASHANGGFPIPLLIGVNHQREVIAQRFTHRG